MRDGVVAWLSTTSDSLSHPTTFGYDSNGNLATVTEASVTTTYTWNARNQLTGISNPGFAASFTYDSFGRRTGKTVQGVVTNFVYDGLNPAQEKNGATVTANLLTGLGIDEFFTRTDGVGVRALMTDALGSTVALGDGTGTLQTQYTYEPFGYTTQTGLASTNSYKYTGREDDGSGLLYYRTRYYHPRLQRFISEDPIGLRGGINRYAYVANNPSRRIDPLGLSPGECKDDDYFWFWYLLCFIDPNCEFPDTPPNPPYIPTVGGQTGSGNVNQGDLQRLPKSEANSVAQQNGYKDAEHMKQDITGRSGGQFNLSVDKSSGQVVLTPVNPGSGPNIPTGVFRK
jgi:RHS repeat-associated protein